MGRDAADYLLPWQKYSTYFYPNFLSVSQLIIPQRTLSASLFWEGNLVSAA